MVYVPIKIRDMIFYDSISDEDRGDLPYIIEDFKYTLEQEVVLTIPSSIKDKEIINTARLLGFTYGIPIFEEKDVKFFFVGLGYAFFAIFQALIENWEYIFDKPYKVNYKNVVWSLGDRFGFKSAISTIESMINLGTVDDYDILPYLIYSGSKKKSIISAYIDQEYMKCKDIPIHMYRVIQYFIRYPKQLESRLTSWYRTAYYLMPKSAPYQGEKDLLLPFHMPNLKIRPRKLVEKASIAIKRKYKDEHTSTAFYEEKPEEELEERLFSSDYAFRIDQFISSEYAYDIIMKDPILGYLYENQLLNNCTVAGGSISAILYFAKMFDDSDIDIFIYGDKKEETLRILMKALLSLYDTLIGTGNTVISVSGAVVSISKIGVRSTQIIVSSSPDLDGILFNFDMSHISVGLTNDGIFGTPAFFNRKEGMETKPMRYILRSHRIEKAQSRGFILKGEYTDISTKGGSIPSPCSIFLTKKGKQDSMKPTLIPLTSYSESIDSATKLIRMDGVFRNDMEALYHSSATSKSLGMIMIVDAKYNPLVPYLCTLVVYRDSDNKIQILYSTHLFGIIILAGDLLLSHEKMIVGDVYELIVTPNSITLVKKRCKGKN